MKKHARTQELEQMNQILEELSTTDALTGLHNRRHLQHFPCDEMERYGPIPTPFSILMMGINHFKKINDSFGHDAGDVVLAGIASMFRDCIRKTDAIARWGGEESLILLPDTGLDGARKLAEKLRRTCADHKFEIEMQVTVSVGVIEYEKDMTGTELLTRVDRALYFAKERGRDRVEAA